MIVCLKKRLWICLEFFILFVTLSQAGEYTFTNADKFNSNWTDQDNWAGRVLPQFNDSCIIKMESNYSVVNADVTIKSLIISENLTSDVVLDGTKTLYFVRDDNNGSFIENNSSANLILNGRYDFYNEANIYKSSYIRNTGAGSSITFCTNSVAAFRSKTIIAKNKAYFFGRISAVNPELYLHSDTCFGKTSSVESKGKCTLAYMTIDVNTKKFNVGTKIGTTTTSTININADNAFKNKPDLDLGGTTTINVNGNAEFGELNFSCGGSKVITINISPNVDCLTFLNSSGKSWGDEKLFINGFRPGIIRFGNNNRGLTADQLAAITIDGAGSKNVTLNNNGCLNNNNQNGLNQIIQPQNVQYQKSQNQDSENKNSNNQNGYTLHVKIKK